MGATPHLHLAQTGYVLLGKEGYASDRTDLLALAVDGLSWFFPATLS